jgi:hypothetical protein
VDNSSDSFSFDKGCTVPLVITSILILGIVALLIWKYNQVNTLNRGNQKQVNSHKILGPDDDPEFMWKVEKRIRDQHHPDSGTEKTGE